jgi:hypothetical protein
VFACVSTLSQRAPSPRTDVQCVCVCVSVCVSVSAHRCTVSVGLWCVSEGTLVHLRLFDTKGLLTEPDFMLKACLPPWSSKHFCSNMKTIIVKISQTLDNLFQNAFRSLPL